jgi:flagellar basal-body rod protein FlgB
MGWVFFSFASHVCAGVPKDRAGSAAKETVEVPQTVNSQLENFLSLASQRQTVIATNIANIDTPGYRTQDIDFQHALAQAGDQSRDSELVPIAHKVPNLLERPDGNNVDMDRESLLMSQTQLQYQIGTQLLKSRFHELLLAINGGAGS